LAEKAKKEAEKVKKEAKKQAEKAKKQAEKAKKQAEKAKKDAEKALKKKEEAKKEAAKAAKKAAKEAEKAKKEAEKKMIESLSSGFVCDVTIPDNSEVPTNSKVIKTWRLRNDGNVAWPKGLVVQRRTSNDRLISTVSGVEVPQLKPGEEAEISVPISTPGKSGKFRSATYSLAFGNKAFGCRFWAIVKAVKKTPVVAKKPEHKHKAKKPEGKAKKPEGKASKDLGAQFESDVTIPDGTIVAPGQVIRKIWKVKNTGAKSWPAGTCLVALPGSSMSGVAVEIKGPVPAGVIEEVKVDLTAPTKTGAHMATYRLQTPDGVVFGHKYWASVTVSAFPSAKQLRDMGLKFLGRKEVVDILQQELPECISQIRQGKSLATILDGLVSRHPFLASDPFIAFVRPMTGSAEKFFSMQMNTALAMYSMWASSPFAPAPTVATPVAVEGKKSDPKDSFVKVENPKAVADEKSVKPKSDDVKSAFIEAMDAKGAEKPKPFRFQKGLEWVRSMGVKAADADIKALLIKHNGSVNKVIHEIFTNPN
jgi:hypothetical protein